MAVNVLVPLLIPLGEQMSNGSTGLTFSQPIYEVEIRENMSPVSLLFVHASTNLTDASVTYGLVSATFNNTFAVKPSSGEVLLQKPLDYEQRAKYEIMVNASAGQEAAYGRVLLKVKDQNDHKPKFSDPLYETQITEGDDSDLPKLVLQVTATDIDEDDELMYTLIHRNPHQPSLDTQQYFSINSTTGKVQLTKPIDRDPPLGKSKWYMDLRVSDGLHTDNATLHINVKDINDNSPHFNPKVMNATIPENAESDLDVITVQAIDYDDPDEGNNAVVTYSLEKNVIDERTGTSIFKITPATGRIISTVCCLDRERTSSYTLQVVATDGLGLKGTGTVIVTVEDENDVTPMFTEPRWDLFVYETFPPNQKLATLTVQDADLYNDFAYRIVPQSGLGWNKFYLISNNSKAVSLSALQPMDYEDPIQRNGFKFRVEVTDKGNSWNDSSHVNSSVVNITLLDDNDNSPIFEKDFVQLSFPEDSPSGSTLQKLTATDKDSGASGEILYSIRPQSDGNECLDIDDIGQLVLKCELDYEDSPNRTYRVMAEDNGTMPKSSLMTLNISLLDVNDNAPHIKEPTTITIQENQRARHVTNIILDDKDEWSLDHGPPFQMKMDPKAPKSVTTSFQLNFNPDGDMGRGSATLISLRQFDREESPLVLIPTIITDSQMVSASVNITVHIADVNDNPMKNGVKTVTVIRPKKSIGRIPLGRVYVEDPDDWDANQKIWQWKSPQHSFHLQQNSGLISADSTILDDRYTLNFKVTDLNHSQKNIKAKVYVSVKTLRSHSMIQPAVPVHITSHSCKQLIALEKERSNLEKLITTMKVITNSSMEILSLHQAAATIQSPVKCILWVTGKSSWPFDQLLLSQKAQINKLSNIQIDQIGLGMCTKFEHSNSTENEHLSNNHWWVIDANQTAFISPILEVQVGCKCRQKGKDSEDAMQLFSRPLLTRVNSGSLCEPNPCLNNGKCIASYNSYRCICEEDTHGPHCKVLRRQFYGNGWAWVEPIFRCKNLHISIQIRTMTQNGLLLYSGPGPGKYTRNGPNAEDVLILQLKDGTPQLLAVLGNTLITLNLSNDQSVLDRTRKFHSRTVEHPRIDDGKWHRIDIVLSLHKVDMILDLCQTRRHKCHKSVSLNSRSTTGNRKYLNLSQSPLQLGGTVYEGYDSKQGEFDFNIAGFRFRGCLRNLQVNGKLMDLGQNLLQHNTTAGCSSDLGCQQSTKDCPENSRCNDLANEDSTCTCKVGWKGNNCDEQTEKISFNGRGFLSVPFIYDISTATTNISFRMRTWSPFGTIIFLQADDRLKEVSVFLFEGFLCLNVMLASSDSTSMTSLFLQQRVFNSTSCLRNTRLNDGRWHTVYANRYGLQTEIWADHGDWDLYNSSFIMSNVIPSGLPDSTASQYYRQSFQLKSSWTAHELTIAKKNGFLLGGRLQYNVNANLPQYKTFNGCLEDIRVNSIPIEAVFNENQTLRNGWVNGSGVEPGCFSPFVCLNVSCPTPLKCKPLWRAHECSCEEGMVLSSGSCVDINECLRNPCLSGGICVNTIPGYYCSCSQGFEGPNCEIQSPRTNFMFSYGIVAGCVAWLLITLVFFLIFIVHKKKRYGKHSQKVETESSEDGFTKISLQEFSPISAHREKATSSQDSEDIWNHRLRSADNSGVPSRSDLPKENEPWQKKYQRPNSSYLVQKSSHILLNASVSGSPFRDDLRHYAYEGSDSTHRSASSCCSGVDGEMPEIR